MHVFHVWDLHLHQLGPGAWTSGRIWGSVPHLSAAALHTHAPAVTSLLTSLPGHRSEPGVGMTKLKGSHWGKVAAWGTSGSRPPALPRSHWSTSTTVALQMFLGIWALCQIHTPTFEQQLLLCDHAQSISLHWNHQSQKWWFSLCFPSDFIITRSSSTAWYKTHIKQPPEFLGIPSSFGVFLQYFNLAAD